ncbi:unnamed protein product [Aphanomyces euteiches]|uniref:WW domain-containing protein n=1 Tax=Aphanomyces euteiches TaxID=100861 RepID=A0A6G0WWF4_9STRA|nr:hypothetical protein Ae201684_010961 [Aphanomyces euteiches]KAH9058746.1 hypothetical protein Ae201684P_006087 [Aphanomyces euteiches]
MQSALQGRQVAFSHRGDLTTGKVLHIDPAAGNMCVVQVDHGVIEIDTKSTPIKVIFQAGELDDMALESMVGKRIEIESPNYDSRGVLKQHNRDLKCSLVRFDSGAKEWLDLTQFKVHIELVRHDMSAIKATEVSSNERADENTTDLNNRPSLELPNVFHDTTSAEMDKKSSVDLYTYHEGTCIELYSGAGEFQEDAVVREFRSHSNKLVLFNEARGVFEVDIAKQLHKVVVHGFSTLKEIAVDNTVEVYSSIKGMYRTGSIVRKAENGKLIPILFDDTSALEWVDLTSQTFKIVFFPSLHRPLSARERERLLNSSVTASREQVSSALQDQLPSPISTKEVAPQFRFPLLELGSRVEIYNASSGRYDKYSVVQQISGRQHTYKLNAPSSKAQVLVFLPEVRCKVIVSDFVSLDLELLMAHVVEVYIREEKRVDAGRICGFNNQNRMLQVRFQGGRKEWLNLMTTKMKIRLHEYASTTTTSNQTCVEINHQQLVEDLRKHLHRSHSYTRNPPSPHPIRRSKSSNMMLQRTPLSPLHQAQNKAPLPVPNVPQLSRTDSNSSLDSYALDSARTVENLSEIDTDPTSEWSMQIDPASKQTFYVHLPSGRSQWHPPPRVDIYALQWIASDEMETNVGFLPSDRSQLPVGPIEAVRRIRLNG